MGVQTDCIEQCNVRTIISPIRPPLRKGGSSVMDNGHYELVFTLYTAVSYAAMIPVFYVCTTPVFHQFKHCLDRLYWFLTISIVRHQRISLHCRQIPMEFIIHSSSIIYITRGVHRIHTPRGTECLQDRLQLAITIAGASLPMRHDLFW